MDMVTRVKTWLQGAPVGTDAYGNRYFQAKRAPATGRRRRWVVYAGTPDASKVPPEWHGWMHYTADAPLAAVARPWIRPHQPNLTGTAAAYRPAGSQLQGGTRARATGDYEAWSPDKG
jgi:NADH:ubiquinone oxidoreductase subunit